MRHGQHHSEATIAKMREFQRAHNPMRGRNHSRRTIQRMRAAAKRLWKSPTYREHQEWARRYQPDKV